jgi:hypothetical protein
MKFAVILKVMTLALILAAASAASAQGKDGKPIGLPKVEKTATPPPPKDISILAPTLNASLRYGVSDIVPVADGEFLLLDKDLNAILRGAGLMTDGGLDEAHTYAVYQIFPDAEHAAFAKAAKAAIAPHIVARASTDKSGVAKFPTIAAGSYYLFGAVKARNGMAIWNEFVRLTAGVETITLDHKNVELTN